MLRQTGLEAQHSTHSHSVHPRGSQLRGIQSKAGAVGVAALFYLSSALETDAEPAQDDQPTTQQAPAPQQAPVPPPPAAPEQAPTPQTSTPPAGNPPQADTATPPSDQKADVPLPTVSVEGNRRQPP